MRINHKAKHRPLLKSILGMTIGSLGLNLNELKILLRSFEEKPEILGIT